MTDQRPNNVSKIETSLRPEAVNQYNGHTLSQRVKSLRCLVMQSQLNLIQTSNQGIHRSFIDRDVRLNELVALFERDRNFIISITFLLGLYDFIFYINSIRTAKVTIYVIFSLVFNKRKYSKFDFSLFRLNSLILRRIVNLIDKI